MIFSRTKLQFKRERAAHQCTDWCSLP